MQEPLNWKSFEASWVILGFFFLFINYVLITPAHPDFFSGLIYAIASFNIALMIYFSKKQTENSILGMILGAVTGCLPLIIYLTSAERQIADYGLYFAVFSVIAMIILNYKKIGVDSKNAKIFILIPMFMWFIWGLTYFYNQVVTMQVFTVSSVLYHFGLMSFAGTSTYRYAISTNENIDKLIYVFLAITLVGMLLLNQNITTFSVWR